MSDRLRTVATFHEPVAAALAKNYLESNGIPAVLIDEATIATDWMLSGAIGGIKLQVLPIHLERAEMLLTQVEAERRELDDEEPMPASAIASREIAEELHSDRVDREPINQLADRLFRCAVFGLIFWPLQGYVLWLLLQWLGEEGSVSPDRRWKIWASALLNVPLWCVVVIPGLYLMEMLSQR